MVKCFWCGAENGKDQLICAECSRKLVWTVFFRGLLRPSIGCLLGAEQASQQCNTSSAPIENVVQDGKKTVTHP